MKYEDYVDLNYKPKNDLIADFYFETPKSLDFAAGGIAAESSIGTWTEISTYKSYVRRLAAKVFSIKRKGKGAIARIAYPIDLFEKSNMPNILSSITGNVFGLTDITSLKVLDVHFPKELIMSFKGPRFGIEGVRKIMRIPSRPLIGTIVKPKIGLITKDHAKVAYDAWAGGCDLVKDDENLSSQKFNKFKNRLEQTFKMKEKAEKETGEKKGYMINVTAETKEMLRRAKLVENYGNEYCMVDILTVGWSGLETLRNEGFDLIIHAHRAQHGALTRNSTFGISMVVLAKIARIIGVDQLHVGSAVGKMFESKTEVLENVNALEKEMPLKKVFPVASGGLSTLSISKVVKIFGKNIIIQLGGGIHGHPKGTFSGARAARQALDASLKGISLEEYSKTHKELNVAIEHWKHFRI